jgi:hypothetical protein
VAEPDPDPSLIGTQNDSHSKLSINLGYPGSYTTPSTTSAAARSSTTATRCGQHAELQHAATAPTADPLLTINWSQAQSDQSCCPRLRARTAARLAKPRSLTPRGHSRRSAPIVGTPPAMS